MRTTLSFSAERTQSEHKINSLAYSKALSACILGPELPHPPTAFWHEASTRPNSCLLRKSTCESCCSYFFADDRLQRSLLLADIRKDRTKAKGDVNSGGDFYGPFWADAKDHAAGRSSLPERTEIRIAANGTRARLYPILRDCFLSMWNEKMRWRNEPFEFTPGSVKAQLLIEELRAIIKIENTASIKVWDGSHRVIYPYFSEMPALPEAAARLGFWALQEALPDYRSEDFRIIDMHRRAYFRPTDVGINHDQRNQFVKRYDILLTKWRKLRDER
jgi:hypothetical protein